MPGFDNEVVYAKNVDFSNGYPVTGQVTADGQLLIGSTAFPNIVVGYITSSDASITVTNGPGTIDITTVGGGGGITWSAISADQTLAVDNGYLCIGGATLNLALPVISAVGTTIEVSLDGSTGFTITQAAGQSIKLGNQTTTAGVGGSLSSTQQGDSLRMVCKTANLAWTVVSAMGNLTFV
jgi:hypothetical protein